MRTSLSPASLSITTPRSAAPSASIRRVFGVRLSWTSTSASGCSRRKVINACGTSWYIADPPASSVSGAAGRRL
jgi:hypothetical protein